jgi:hypothetical protein
MNTHHYLKVPPVSQRDQFFGQPSNWVAVLFVGRPSRLRAPIALCALEKLRGRELALSSLGRTRRHQASLLGEVILHSSSMLGRFSMRAQNASTAMALEKKVRKIKNDSRTTYFERVHLHDVLELVPLLVLVLVLLLAVAIFFVVIVIVIVSVLAFVAAAVVLGSHN